MQQIIQFLTQKIVDVFIASIFALYRLSGYWAKETICVTKKFAFARATALGLDPSAEICRWYGIISCCLQRANAKILRGEPVTGRHSAPPPGCFFSQGRDLALVGA